MNKKIKSIIKKAGWLISSRGLYLLLGILLAVSGGYVYATWDQARTGGSGELSESNWNELVTMIENNVGVGGGGAPGTWTCVTRSNGGWYNGTGSIAKSAACVGSEKAVTGGCNTDLPQTLKASHPTTGAGEGWVCSWKGNGVNTYYSSIVSCCE